jgi:hypothetical protein
VSSIAISCIVFACVFGGALLALFVARALPEHHLSGESKDVIKLMMDSAAQSQLRAALGIAAGGYDSFATGLEALARGEIDAFVAGEPILRYEVANRFHGRLQVLGSSFMREDYAFALPLNSGLRGTSTSPSSGTSRRKNGGRCYESTWAKSAPSCSCIRWRQRTGEERLAALLSRACP